MSLNAFVKDDQKYIDQNGFLCATNSISFGCSDLFLG
jgi:hypothetical protein